MFVRNELLLLYNNKAFILILNQAGIVVYNEIVDLPTFESVKNTFLWKWFRRSKIIWWNLLFRISWNNSKYIKWFYEKNGVFIEKKKLIYVLKQLTNEENRTLISRVYVKSWLSSNKYRWRNFELSKDKHLKKVLQKPRKKKKKRF